MKNSKKKVFEYTKGKGPKFYEIKKKGKKPNKSSIFSRFLNF